MRLAARRVATSLRISAATSSKGRTASGTIAVTRSRTGPKALVTGG